MHKKKIVCFGPGPKFKGGIANYNTALAKALDQFNAVEVHIVSWTQQYPAIIPRVFTDTSSQWGLLDDTDIPVTYITNFNNPRSWHTTYQYIVGINPDMVIVQFSIALQGLPIGYIIKRLKKLLHIEVIVDLHFVVQKEQSLVDAWLVKQGIGHADTYLVHAHKTFQELQGLFPRKKFYLTNNGTRGAKGQPTAIQLYHPIYDFFQPNTAFDAAAFKKQLKLRRHVFLFFGFIRQYKGLHHAIKAFRLVAGQRDDVSLLICGESFWHTLDNKKLSVKLKKWLFGLSKRLLLRKPANEKNYQPLRLIKALGLEDQVSVVNRFIPNEEVHRYFQVSDCVVLFYTHATPSGIESISYHFGLPVLATRVGHFPETIQTGVNGYLAMPKDIPSMAATMFQFLKNPVPSGPIRAMAKKLSWQRYAQTILHTGAVARR